jgi:hypothetical protein
MDAESTTPRELQQRTPRERWVLKLQAMMTAELLKSYNNYTA